MGIVTVTGSGSLSESGQDRRHDVICWRSSALANAGFGAILLKNSHLAAAETLVAIL
jgi:hypothetical protein